MGHVSHRAAAIFFFFGVYVYMLRTHRAICSDVPCTLASPPYLGHWVEQKTF